MNNCMDGRMRLVKKTQYRDLLKKGREKIIKNDTMKN